MLRQWNGRIGTVVWSRSTTKGTSSRAAWQHKGGDLAGGSDYDVEDESDRDFWCELKGKKGYITLKQARVAKKKGDGARRAAQDLVQKYNSRRGGGGDDGDCSVKALEDGDGEMNRYRSVLKVLFLEVVSGHVAAKSASGGVSTKTANF